MQDREISVIEWAQANAMKEEIIKFDKWVRENKWRQCAYPADDWYKTDARGNPYFKTTEQLYKKYREESK